MSKAKCKMSLMNRYQRLLRKRFLLVQGIQTGTLLATGDIISQEVVEKRKWEGYRVRRTIEFAALGGLLVGPAVGVWYTFLARQFGHKKNLYTTVRKVACDQLIFAPTFLCIFIATLETIHGKNIEQIKEVLDKKYCDILKTNWKVWPAFQMVNFYLVPLKYQVLVVQTVAVLWNTYLSWKTQN